MSRGGNERQRVYLSLFFSAFFFLAQLQRHEHLLFLFLFLFAQTQGKDRTKKFTGGSNDLIDEKKDRLYGGPTMITHPSASKSEGLFSVTWSGRCQHECGREGQAARSSTRTLPDSVGLGRTLSACSFGMQHARVLRIDARSLHASMSRALTAQSPMRQDGHVPVISANT